MPEKRRCLTVNLENETANLAWIGLPERASCGPPEKAKHFAAD
jgi:hypothetical protein